jgi:hypothetical protein
VCMLNLCSVISISLLYVYALLKGLFVYILINVGWV